MVQRTKEQKMVLADRAKEWNETHAAPLAAAIRDYAGTRTAGKPPLARVYLRDETANAEAVANETLAAVVAGVVRQDSLTAMAGNVASAVAKMLGKPHADNKAAIACGYVLIGLMCDVTGAAAIADKHGDRPEKVVGGVKVTPSYELAIIDGRFLEDAAEFGATGMPTYSKAPPAEWTAQKSGGIAGQAGGMVHSAGKQMAGITPALAPDLFRAMNIAQRAEFRVNPTCAGILMGYDAAKAFDWLLAHNLATGMEQAKAERKAREDSRL